MVDEGGGLIIHFSRELRQCTIRSESSERLEEEERKLKIVKRMQEKDEHNLKYVYSLRLY